MRCIPPKSKKKQFTRDEFKKYLFDHKLVGDGKPITLMDFFLEESRYLGCKRCAIRTVLTIFPWQYHHIVECIFLEMLKKNEFDKYLKEENAHYQNHLE